MTYLDDEWEDYIITEVAPDRSGEWYTLSFREPGEERGVMGFSLGVAGCETAGVVPRAGDFLRLCGSFGRPVRGAIINDALIYYRTEEQDRAKWAAEKAVRDAERLREFEETGKAKLDAQYAALPPIFQARIDKFRRNNPDFRVEYEAYEMFCCEEAVKLARHLGTIEAMDHYVSLARHETHSTDVARWHREWEEQKAIDVAAGISDEHSGNTHGSMVALASLYLRAPENVEKMHGALAPLVGSFEYGCVPPDEAI